MNGDNPKSIRSRIVTGIAISLLSAATCEIALRVLPLFSSIGDHMYDRKIFYPDGSVTWEPNSTSRHRSPKNGLSQLIQTNSLGFRGPEPLPRPTYRIVVVGDSIPFGGGIADDAIFPRILETKIRNRFKNDNIDVINLSVGDTSIVDYQANIKKFVPRLSPNMVIIALYYNDAIDPLGSMINRGRLSTSPSLYRSRLIDQLNYIWKASIALTTQFDRFGWASTFSIPKSSRSATWWAKLVQEASVDWGHAWAPEFWKVITARLVETQREIPSSTALKIMLMPVSPQLELPETYPEIYEPQRKLRLLAQETGLAILDPLPYLRTREASLYMFDQCHLTEMGHTRVAEFLFEQIKPEEISPDNMLLR